MQAFNVYLETFNGPTKKRKLIDTVFWNDGFKITKEQVRISLINHDGYEDNIYVTKVRKSRTPEIPH